jgi:prepilin-type N-terminal cleavage/methylation domain-containing protein
LPTPESLAGSITNIITASRCDLSTTGLASVALIDYNSFKMLALNKNNRGFTIIELLVVIGVFAFVLPALAAGINNLTVLNNRARDLSLANMLAENKAEQLRNAGFNSLSPGTVSFSNELPNELAPPRSGSYTISNPEAGIAEVVIDINYRDYGQTRSLQFKTIVSELGVGQ